MFCYYRLCVFGLGRRPMPSGDLSISGSQSPRNPFIPFFQRLPSQIHYVKNARPLFFSAFAIENFPSVRLVTPGHLEIKWNKENLGVKTPKCIKHGNAKHHAEPLILRRHPNRTTVPTCMPKGYQNTSRLRNDKPKERENRKSRDVAPPKSRTT